MIINYRNSRNQIRHIDINENKISHNGIINNEISYVNIDFQKKYPFYLKINGRLIPEYDRDLFLKKVEYFEIKDQNNRKDYMVFEINCLSEYINVIMFYRFIDMLEKLIGINIFNNLSYGEPHKLLKKYINPNFDSFFYYRDLIIKGQINWKNEAQKLFNIIEKDNYNNSLDNMIDVIKSYLFNPTDIYYRGVGTPIYPEQPGIFRLHNGEHETKMFKDMMVRYPHIFKNSNTIESLTHMQHYELKTRLLDITTNPLVALYMAVNKIYTGDYEQTNYGEVIVYFTDVNSVKYYDSNKVLLNSKLIFLSHNEKDSLYEFIKKIENLGNSIVNKVQEKIWNYEKNNEKLVDEILQIVKALNYDEINKALNAYFKLLSIVRCDNAAFVNKIELRGLLKAYIVNVGYVNERITAQSGGFILFGLDQNYLTNPNNKADDIISSRTINGFPRIIIKNKIQIYEELNAIGINDSTMIPDIEHASKFIIEKYR